MWNVKRPINWPGPTSGATNMLLKRQGETLSVVGNGGKDNVVASLSAEDKSQHVAVLSRTVASVIGVALEASLAGRKVYWVGGIAGYKTEMLDMYLFKALSEVQYLTENWRTEYNKERPHSSLGNLPSVIYA